MQSLAHDDLETGGIPGIVNQDLSVILEATICFSVGSDSLYSTNGSFAQFKKASVT